MTVWRSGGKLVRIDGAISRCEDCPCGCPCSAGYSGVSVTLTGQPGPFSGGALDYVDSFETDGIHYCTWFKSWGDYSAEEPYGDEWLVIALAFIRNGSQRFVTISIDGKWQFPGRPFPELWAAYNLDGSAPTVDLDETACDGLSETFDAKFCQGLSCSGGPETTYGYIFLTTTPV